MNCEVVLAISREGFLSSFRHHPDTYTLINDIISQLQGRHATTEMDKCNTLITHSLISAK